MILGCALQTAAAKPPIVAAVATTPAGKAGAALLAYVVCLAFSGIIVRRLTRIADGQLRAPPSPEDLRLGQLIGKCENILVVTCMLAGEFGALGLIFAAKSLVRAKQIEQQPLFFLGGTLVNLVWSMSIGALARLVVAGA